MRYVLSVLLTGLLCTSDPASGQKNGSSNEAGNKEKRVQKSSRPGSVYYGIASYYADHFKGRRTATGDDYGHHEMTAACNNLPFGTWIRVTNLRNNRSVIVQVNDRLHAKSKRIVDLSYSAAQKLGYIQSGLTQVRVQVLGVKKV